MPFFYGRSKVRPDSSIIHILECSHLEVEAFACREANQWLECGIERLYPDPGDSQENVHARYRVIDTVLQPLEGMVKDRAMHQALLGSPR